MVSLVSTVAYLGLEARAVEVQCQMAPGLPSFRWSACPTRPWAKAASGCSPAALGLALPPASPSTCRRPTCPRKARITTCRSRWRCWRRWAWSIANDCRLLAVGELALDGRIIPSPGVLLAALHASGADKGLICPAAQGTEARWASGIDVIAAPDLSLLNHLKGTQRLAPPEVGEAMPPVRLADLGR
jgi:magnesium chelatase family protein